MKDVQSLENEKLLPLYFRMVVPAVASQLVNLAYNIVDRIYIGHIPETGKFALAGTGICLPVIMIVSAFSQLGGIGGASRFSFFLGSGSRRSAGDTLTSCASFLLISGLLITLIVRMFPTEILTLFGAGSETMPYALDYLKIYVWGTVFVELASGLVFFITAQGCAQISLISLLLGAGLNIILDPVFIFHFGMGVKGAAAATVVSQCLAACFVLRFLMSDRSVVRLKKKVFQGIKGSELWPSLALGVSPFVMQITESLVSISYNRSLFRYGGTQAVGAMTVFSSIMTIVVYPLMGIGQGVQPIISYNYGAKNYRRVKKTCYAALFNGLVYSSVIWGLIRCMPGFFVKAFSSDLEFSSYIISYSAAFFLMLWVMGGQVVTQNMFLALGNARLSLFLALLRKMILLIPLIRIIPLLTDDKVMGVFLAEPAADTLAAITTVTLFFVRYRSIMKAKP